MALARPYFDRNHFKDWDRERLITALIEARTRVMELGREVQRVQERVEAAEPWYATGQPMPYTPADGQW